jgi:hypothetical protein
MATAGVQWMPTVKQQQFGMLLSDFQSTLTLILNLLILNVKCGIFEKRTNFNFLIQDYDLKEVFTKQPIITDRLFLFKSLEIIRQYYYSPVAVYDLSLKIYQ